jgi:peptidyl-prolyl cis-trans isomerase SurA
MNDRFRPLCGWQVARTGSLFTALTALTVLLSPMGAGAQSPLRQPVPTAATAASASTASPAPRPRTELTANGVQTTSDYIVAVVNQELITHTEIDKRLARIQDAAQPGAKLPPTDELRRQVLDALIDEKVQASYGKATGMDINDAELDGTIEGIAGQNQLTVPELKQRMQESGMDYARYRSTLREQLLLQRLREREVNSRIQISDNDVDDFLQNDPAAKPEGTLSVAHILIAVPEKATAMEIQILRSKALEVQQRAAKGGDFAELARDNSDDAKTRAQGGALGKRPASRLPELFANTTREMKAGQVSQIVRSGAGFHVIKVLAREDSTEPTYTQQHARHILLRAPTGQAPTATVDRLEKIRQQITSGATSFDQAAKQYSEDGSAAKGGDLGWASPGQFVPEFEKALAGLKPGEMSEPVVSRFGVHLIQLIERRDVKMSDAQKREAARNVLKERKFETAYEEWARELRAAAWIEVREAP